MRRASTIEKESLQIGTIQDLTGVFESIASTQVAKVKNRVELSKQFFQLLWARYSAIRIDPTQRITLREDNHNGRKAFILISAEAGLSGDIDARLIETVLQDYNDKDTDIIVLGSHGAQMLTQREIHYERFFQVPETDQYIDVSPVIEVVRPYSNIVIYYEEYVSLGVQDIKKIDLISNIREMSEEVDDENAISLTDTLFEPSLDEIADEMEETMKILVLSQTILESGLAQAASRFNAMAVAKKRAGELLGEYKMEYHRARRSESDRRLREVMVSLKKKRRTAAAGGR